MTPNFLWATQKPCFTFSAVRNLFFVTILLLYSTCIFSANTLKMAVLQFGTANWELDVIKRHGLDTEHGFTLEAIKMAGKTGHYGGPPSRIC